MKLKVKKNLTRSSIVGPIEDPLWAKAQESNSSSPCANLQFQTSKKTIAITQTPTQRLRFCMIKDRPVITLNPNELETVPRWRTLQWDDKRGGELQQPHRSGRWRMPEQSFQERWRNQVERSEERRQMLQKRSVGEVAKWEQEWEGLCKWKSTEMSNLPSQSFWSTVESTTHYWAVDVICDWAFTEMLTLAT